MNFMSLGGFTRSWLWAMVLGMLVSPALRGADLEEKLQSERYQLIKISDQNSIRVTWVEEREEFIMDLRDLKSTLDANPDTPENVHHFVAELTQNYTRPYELRDVLHPDHTAYFSTHWRRKGSMLTIAEYEKSGSMSDLNAYLGPLADIPTVSYGMAQFEVHYKGETLSFLGGVLKAIWSLRPKYWSKATVYLPLEEAAKDDIALISHRVPIGVPTYLPKEGTYLLIPRAK